MSELNSSSSSIEKIKEYLKDGKPRNISEVSKKANLTWEVAKTTLNKLEFYELIFFLFFATKFLKFYSKSLKLVSFCKNLILLS